MQAAAERLALQQRAKQRDYEERYGAAPPQDREDDRDKDRERDREDDTGKRGGLPKGGDDRDSERDKAAKPEDAGASRKPMSLAEKKIEAARQRERELEEARKQASHASLSSLRVLRSCLWFAASFFCSVSESGVFHVKRSFCFLASLRVISSPLLPVFTTPSLTHTPLSLIHAGFR